LTRADGGGDWAETGPVAHIVAIIKIVVAAKGTKIRLGIQLSPWLLRQETTVAPAYQFLDRPGHGTTEADEGQEIIRFGSFNGSFI
jgi:hypothetical protein